MSLNFLYKSGSRKPSAGIFRKHYDTIFQMEGRRAAEQFRCDVAEAMLRDGRYWQMKFISEIGYIVIDGILCDVQDWIQDKEDEIFTPMPMSKELKDDLNAIQKECFPCQEDDILFYSLFWHSWNHTLWIRNKTERNNLFDELKFIIQKHNLMTYEELAKRFYLFTNLKLKESQIFKLIRQA